MSGLALDLAGRSGWAVGDNFLTARVGVWNLPGFADSKIDRSLGGIYSGVNFVCREYGVTFVIIEAALRTISKKNSRGVWTPTSAHGDRCLTMLQGAARAGAANAGVTVFKYPAPNTWRAQIFGEGYPKDPKAKAVEYCNLRGRNIADHNAAEALCILEYDLSQRSLLDRIKG